MMESEEVGSVTTPSDPSISDIYVTKRAEYYAGVREDWLAELPEDPRTRILEIGCGRGDTGREAIRTGKAGYYAGVELSAASADIARAQISDVIQGDVAVAPMKWPNGHFDVIFASEVLEHLVDPHSVLRRLRPLLRPKGRIFASSPNVAYFRVVSMVVFSGEWRLTEFGIMDATHMRWFTPHSYRRMFEESGYAVERVRPVTPLTRKRRIFDVATFGKLTHLLFPQIDLRARVACTAHAECDAD